ncbi:MAG: tetratricopeptide repeat protein [Flavobacteriales bacterium]|nr:tetratricopeptide repeat protein [Flavobacteriales bacterium]
MTKSITYAIAVVLLLLASCRSAQETTVVTLPDGQQKSAPPDTRFADRFFEGQTALALKQPSKAYIAFEACLSVEPKSAAVHYELARLDTAMKNFSGAVQHMKTALTEDESNPWYHRLMAELYEAQGKWELAAKEYASVRKLNPLDPEALFGQADALLSAGKIQESIQVINEMEQTDGVSPEISIQKHQLYLQLNDAEKAGLELEKLAGAYPEDARYWGMCAQFYQRIGRTDKALSALEQLKLHNPENGEVHMQLSEFYAATGDDAKSLEELKLAFDSPDVSIDNKIGILLRYFSLTDFDPSQLSTAYELLDKAVAVHPSEAKAHSMYGDFLYRDNRLEEARTHYRQAVALDHTRSAIWTQLLVINAALEDYAALEKESARAMELFSLLPEYYYYNGIAHTRLGAYDRAISALNTGKELVVLDDTMLIQFYIVLGDAYRRAGQHDKSDNAMNEALKVNPDNPKVLNNYAYFLSLRGVRLDEAEKMIGRAMTMTPGEPAYLDTYAWVLYMQGKYPEALDAITKALAGMPKADAEVSEHYGDILYRNGRVDEAVEQWKSARALGISSPALEKKIVNQRIEN